MNKNTINVSVYMDAFNRTVLGDEGRSGSVVRTSDFQAIEPGFEFSCC